MFASNHSLTLQVTVGIIYGCFAGFLCLSIVQSKLMVKSRKKYIKVFQNFKLTWVEIIFLSICAGVGEEIFFRGVIQPFFGILVTAIFFVAIHGYLNPTIWSLFVYGLIMTFVIIGVGILHTQLGIIAPIISHTIIDVILLRALSTNNFEE